MPAVREGGDWAAESRLKQRSAALSVLSNSGLILRKVVAGTITGSVSLLTEAVHSSIDLVASVVAFFSVRKADEPADESHRYGHEKIENLAAAIEGILILIGSAAIAFEAIRHLVGHGTIRAVGLGIAVAAISLVVNVGVSFRLARAARRTDCPALAGDAAHLGTDALTSATVLIGLVLVDVTGAQWIDPVVALAVAVVIVRTGVRLLLQSSRVMVDEALPPAEVEAIRSSIAMFGDHGVVGYHELRTRRAGSRRYVDLHVQFREGTSLEAAHRIAHELQDMIGERLRGADVLIHLEPEDPGAAGGDAPHRGAGELTGSRIFAVTVAARTTFWRAGGERQHRWSGRGHSLGRSGGVRGRQRGIWDTPAALTPRCVLDCVVSGESAPHLRICRRGGLEIARFVPQRPLTVSLSKLPLLPPQQADRARFSGHSRRIGLPLASAAAGGSDPRGPRNGAPQAQVRLKAAETATAKVTRA